MPVQGGDKLPSDNARANIPVGALGGQDLSSKAASNVYSHMQGHKVVKQNMINNVTNSNGQMPQMKVG